jgi:predicted site-specific integrase-resolvase
MGGTMEAQRDQLLTVTRWAKGGKLSSIRTLGGHRRYHAEEINRALSQVQ